MIKSSTHYCCYQFIACMCATVLESMDLPPDKAKVLRLYNDERKWEMIRDQEMVKAKESPQFYLQKLSAYLDPKVNRSSKKRRIVGDTSSTQVLRDLEISLRTNNIEWVREFLCDDNKGLDVLIEYLTVRLTTQRLLEQQRQIQLAQRSPDASNGDCQSFDQQQSTLKAVSTNTENSQSTNLFR